MTLGRGRNVCDFGMEFGIQMFRCALRTGLPTAGGEAGDGWVELCGIHRALESDVPDLLPRHDAWAETRIQVVGDGRANLSDAGSAYGPVLKEHACVFTAQPDIAEIIADHAGKHRSSCPWRLVELGRRRSPSKAHAFPHMSASAAPVSTSHTHLFDDPLRRRMRSRLVVISKGSAGHLPATGLSPWRTTVLRV